MPALRADLRLAIRQLRRSPGFTLVAVLILALGIGANSAIFTLVDRAFLRPLSLEQADRLVLVWGENPGSGWSRLPLSFPNYTDLRASARGFEELGAWASSRERRLGLSGAGGPEEVQYAAGSASLFRALRVSPELGRIFSDDEDRPDAERVALVSHDLWQRRFGAGSALGDRSLILDGASYRIVGVLPAGFNFVSYPRSPDLWLPLQADPSVGRGNRSVRYARGASYLGVLGRLREGASLDAARTDLIQLAGGLARSYPEFNTGWSLDLVPLRDQITGPLQRGLLLLAGAVGLVLLIAVANVAGLLLARGAAREREIAIRAALGAGRARLLSQLLTESALLGLIGGGAGFLLATWLVALPVFANLSHPDLYTPYTLAAAPFTPDLRVLGFTLAVSLLTGLAAGASPAFRASRPDLQDALRGDRGRGAGRRSPQRARRFLVMTQVSVSMVLLVGSGLLVRSLLTLQRIDRGFRPDHVLVADLNLSRSRYADPTRAAVFYRTLLERLAAVPGVRSAAAAEQLPLSGQIARTDFRIAGRPVPAPNTEPEAQYGSVTPDYFRTLGIQVKAGRAFLPSDDARAARVAVVNESMARRYWPGEDPVGKRVALSVEALVFGPDGPPRLDFEAAAREVVGVVADVRGSGPTAGPEPEVLVPAEQRPVRDMALTLVTVGDPLELAQSVRQAVLQIDPEQALSSVRSLDAMVAGSLGEPRFNALLLSAFAATALCLAAVGLYGLVAASVGERRREIGVRVALGARPRDVMLLVFREGMRPVLAGLPLGALAALGATRLLRGLLYGVAPADPLSYLGVAAVLGLTASLACWLPTRPVLRVDPMEALRAD